MMANQALYMSIFLVEYSDTYLIQMFYSILRFYNTIQRVHDIIQITHSKYIHHKQILLERERRVIK